MKFEIFKFERVTSTNDVAINLINEQNKLAGCIYSDLQTKGRGTYGKKWISEKGNLFLTLFFPIEKKYPTFQEFSIINPIIILNIVKNYCNEKKLRLKFPNDILYDGKKFANATLVNKVWEITPEQTWDDIHTPSELNKYMNNI